MRPSLVVPQLATPATIRRGKTLVSPPEPQLGRGHLCALWRGASAAQAPVAACDAAVSLCPRVAHSELLSQPTQADPQQPFFAYIAPKAAHEPFNNPLTARVLSMRKMKAYRCDTFSAEDGTGFPFVDFFGFDEWSQVTAADRTWDLQCCPRLASCP